MTTLDPTARTDVAESLSFRFSQSMLFKFAIVGLGAAAILAAGVVLGLTLDESQDLPGSEGMWGTIGFVVGAVASISYGIALMGWSDRLMAAARREITAWVNTMGLEEDATSELTASMQARPFSSPRGHKIEAGWRGTHLGRDLELFHLKVGARSGNRDAQDPIERYTVVAIHCDSEFDAAASRADALAAASDAPVAAVQDGTTLALVHLGYEARLTHLEQMVQIATQAVTAR